MTIDNFNNNEGGGSVRTKLNNAIDRANDLNDRVGAASGAGIVAIDGLGESVRRSLLSGDGSVEITNGDGVSENPNVSVAGYVTSRVGQGSGIAAYDAQGNPLRRSVVSSDGSVEITNPDGVAGNVDLSASGAVSTANATQDDTQRNLQMDEQVYKIIRDTLGPDAPMPYVLDEANGSYPHTSRGNFARLGGAWGWDRFRRLREYGPDERRDSFDPATGAPRGRLYEPEQTSLMGPTKTFGYGMNAIGFDPAETNLPTLFDETSGLRFVRGTSVSKRLDTTSKFGLTAGEWITVFFLSKPVVGSINAAPHYPSSLAGWGHSGADSGKIIKPLSNGWYLYKHEVLLIDDEDTTNLRFYTRPSLQNAAEDTDEFILGGQWYAKGKYSENPEILQTPILSDASGVIVRPPDLATYPLDFEGWNPNEGTFVVVGAFTAPDGVMSAVLSYGGTSNTDRSWASINRNSDSFHFGLRQGFREIPFTTHPYADGKVECMALSWDSSNYQGAVSGNTTPNQTTNGLWPDETPLRLASSLSGSAPGYASGGYSLAMYLPAKLTDTQLADLTAALQSLYNGGA